MTKPLAYVILVPGIGNTQNAVDFRETVLTVPSAAGQIGFDRVVPVLVCDTAQAPVNGLRGNPLEAQFTEVIHQVDGQDIAGVVGGVAGRETVHLHLLQQLVIFQDDTQLLEGGLDTFNADPLLWLRLLPGGQRFPPVHHPAGIGDNLLHRMAVGQQALNLLQGQAVLYQK